MVVFVLLLAPLFLWLAFGQIVVDAWFNMRQRVEVDAESHNMFTRGKSLIRADLEAIQARALEMAPALPRHHAKTTSLKLALNAYVDEVIAHDAGFHRCLMARRVASLRGNTERVNLSETWYGMDILDKLKAEVI